LLDTGNRGKNREKAINEVSHGDIAGSLMIAQQ